MFKIEKKKQTTQKETDRRTDVRTNRKRELYIQSIVCLKLQVVYSDPNQDCFVHAQLISNNKQQIEEQDQHQTKVSRNNNSKTEARQSEMNNPPRGLFAASWLLILVPLAGI